MYSGVRNQKLTLTINMNLRRHLYAISFIPALRIIHTYILSTLEMCWGWHHHILRRKNALFTGAARDSSHVVVIINIIMMCRHRRDNLMLGIRLKWIGTDFQTLRAV